MLLCFFLSMFYYPWAHTCSTSHGETCCHTCYTGLWRDAVRVARRSAAQAASIDSFGEMLDIFRKGVDTFRLCM